MKTQIVRRNMADVCVLKADEIRLQRNQIPESEIAQNFVEEEARNNDLTRFERFKRWSKKTWVEFLWLLYPLRVSLQQSLWAQETS